MRPRRASILQSVLWLCLGCLSAATLVAQVPPGPQAQPLPGPLAQPLRLPESFIQVLPINKKVSYVGDAIRFADCPDDKYAPFGACGNVLFGGLALYDSHLSGFIQIRFYPPVNNIAHFEISHPGNLSGDDATMKAPQLYEYPVQGIFVVDDLTSVSSGDLNLLTGDVTNLDYREIIFNSFYTAFADVNPKLHGAAFRFPGLYGTMNIEFSQRPDGMLDVTLDGQTFLPLSNNVLGDPIRIPVPFCGPLMDCGSIQAPGTSFHPHIHLSTSQVDFPGCGTYCPSISPNSMQVLTFNSRQTTVGDRLTLNIPQLGGNKATGRAQLQGRMLVQFGEPSGGTIPFVMSGLSPGGLLAKPPSSPLDAFGVSVGPLAADFNVPFPASNYQVTNTVLFTDPFDVAVGAVDIQTGQVIGKFLYRSFVLHNLLLAVFEHNLGNLAPSSFRYRGPAMFQKGASGELVFRYAADYHFALAGLVWPAADFNRARAYVAGDGSVQDQFFRVQAVGAPEARAGIVKTGSASNLVSSFGKRFSYSYSILCNDPGRPGTFDYTNTADGGTFHLENLSIVTCTNSMGSTAAPGDFDTVSFAGFGTWSKDDQPHLANVQVSTGPGREFVSIQIDGGGLSNADTPPPQEPMP